MCIDAGQHAAVMSRTDDHFLDHRYNIGIWAWELQRFPARWFDRSPITTRSGSAPRLSPMRSRRFRRFRSFAFRRSSPAMRGVVRRTGRGGADPMSPCSCSSLICAATSLARIRWRSSRPFVPHSDPPILFGWSSSASTPRPIRQASGPDRPRLGAAIDIHAGYSAEASAALASCDTYVSLHRSEGIGLTIAEAMGIGKPVIATGWSGNTDFMDVLNAFR